MPLQQFQQVAQQKGNGPSLGGIVGTSLSAANLLSGLSEVAKGFGQVAGEISGEPTGPLGVDTSLPQAKAPMPESFSPAITGKPLSQQASEMKLPESPDTSTAMQRRMSDPGLVKTNADPHLDLQDAIGALSKAPKDLQAKYGPILNKAYDTTMRSKFLGRM